MKEGIGAKVLRVINSITNPLLIGGLFSLYAVAVRLYIYPKYKYLFANDVVLISNFIEWFGVVYGLFIALVLVNTWRQFELVEREFDKEADAVFMLYQSAKQIKENKNIRRQKKGQKKGQKEEQKEIIIGGIRDYVAHVIDFFQREHQNLNIKDTGDKMLEKIRDAIAELVHTEEPESITSELVRGFGEAADLRGDRISHSKQHILAPLWTLSVAASVLWLIPFYLLDFNSPVVAVVLVGSVTVIVVAILVIMKDLDNVFEGTWKITITDWEIIGEKIDLKPTLLFVYDLDSSPFSAARAFIAKLRSKRLCALYSLLIWGEQKKTFFETFEKLAFLRKFHQEEFAELYGLAEPLPVVFCKSSSKREVIIRAAELKDIPTLTDLGTLIQERMSAFHSQ